ncbi:LysE family translocator [Flavobacteriaceae bacterium F89]|uniref:LysE family translocator n=1 Tax=Cerina litoralis TaxID=2874477 RepID=A0AAE3EX69_9FLAO|nr:LysE family translocator [Cerina litoralis]MCG2461769.1 LysE family translocator [Cerina litoralis]
MDYNIIIAFVIATTALALSPGPDNIYVLTQSMVYGKKYGYVTAAGLVSGCLVHTTLMAFGVSILIKNNPNLFFTIKFLGALYLFYLAFQVYKSDFSLDLAKGIGPRKGFWKLFGRGFVMNVLNPKVTLFFLAFFPTFLFSSFLNVIIQFYALGLLFMAIAFVVFCGIAYFSGSLANYLSKHSKATGILKWVQITVLVGIAVYILFLDN